MENDKSLTASEIDYLCDRAADMGSRICVRGDERLALIQAILGASNEEVRTMARYLINQDNRES